ncbi:MAG TPA: metalloprotease family protein [Capsulimonadaceae bacterium]|jgi:hypothetical protein
MIPGILITLITFPGVIVHEIAHQLFCRLMRVAVFDVCYFRVGNPAGYVIHETPRTNLQHLVIGIGPFLVNSIAGALIAFPSAMAVIKFDAGGPLDYVLVWLGVSIAMHAFPSTGDASSIWSGLKDHNAPIWLKIVVAPVVALIYIGAIGSIFWLDLIYGIAVAMAGPMILAKLLA